MSMPIVIRCSGAAYLATVWISAIVIVVFVFDTAKGAYQRDIEMVAIWLAGAAVFAVMLVRTATLRVVLDGDQIQYGNFFQPMRGLTLAEIRNARGVARHAYRGFSHYLVIEPMNREAAAMRIRTDFFSHADVQTIRNFLGDKLITGHRRSASNRSFS